MICLEHSVSIYEGAVIHVVLKLSTVDDKVLDGTTADNAEESPSLNAFIFIVHLKCTTSPYLVQVLDDMSLTVELSTEGMIIVIVIKRGQSTDRQEVILMVEAVTCFVLRFGSTPNAICCCFCNFTLCHFNISAELEVRRIELLGIILYENAVDDGIIKLTDGAGKLRPQTQLFLVTYDIRISFCTTVLTAITIRCRQESTRNGIRNHRTISSCNDDDRLTAIRRSNVKGHILRSRRCLAVDRPCPLQYIRS